ncbi:MAG TPA: T9SS type A sorting domain-containing protein, partial [Flavobacteriales bacterium]|nr:T9SS type A sorting domain-containing protein [Flavobacteriales bacterium]
AATRNHTLVRKCPISQGDTSWTNAAGTDPVNSQWIVFAQNDWTNIGFHNTCVCDSSTNSYTSITDTICNGLSIVVGNSTYDSTGVYSDTLLALNGCDSIITTTLTVLSGSASSVINDTTICDGDSIVVGSNVYIVAGSYTDILVNSAGCDSIITTNLTVQTPVYQSMTLCDGNSITVGSSVYNTTGTYTDTLSSSLGCDSIVHTNLTIYYQFNSIFGGIPNNTVGGGGFYNGSQYLELSAYMPSELVSAMVYAQDTILTTFQIRDDNGNVLDSTTINVIPGGHRIYFNFPLAGGSDYQLGLDGNSTNLFRSNNGVNYPYNFNTLAAITNSSAGSGFYYFFYDIEIKQSSQPSNYSICAGDSIVVGGNVYNASGLYTDSLTTSIGCDSLVFTNLIVYPNSAFSNPQNICSGAVYAIGNNVYDSTGVYSDTLVAANGCDSIVTTTLNVSSSSVSITTNDTTICDGDSIVVNGNVYNSTALYSDTLINSVGCDSVINTNLTVQTPIYQDTTICNGDTVFVGTSFYTATGSYIDTFQSSIGCDSIVHTNLTIYSQISLYDTISGGIPDTSVGGGNFYSGSQYLELSCYESSDLVSAVIYSADTTLTTFEIRDNNGNVLEDLTVNVIPGGHRIYFNYNMSAGLDYELGLSGNSNDLFRHNSGVNYPYNFGPLAAITNSSAGSGFYYFFYDIEVRKSPANYSICDGDSIIVAGSIYTTTGLYTDSLTSSIGCDSLVYSNVIVSPHVSYINNQTICSGEITIVGSSIYDSTGVYIDTLSSSFACDSVVTTNLTVLSISAGVGTNNQTICFGDSITVGNSTYFNAGIYSDTLSSSNGCDSVVTTTLTTLTANYTSIFGGILDSSSAPGAFSTWNGYLELTCSNISNIASAKVYALDTNTITFELRDNNGIVLEDETIIVYPGQQRVNLNFTIPVGNDFQLGISSGNSGLYRSNAGQGNSQLYPFNIGPVSITGSNASDQYYYFFYDVEITPNITINTLRICDGESVTINGNVYDSTGVYTDNYTAFNGCDSIVETQLTVDTAVTAQITQNGVNIEANVSGGTNPYSYIWSSGQTSQSIMPLVNGSYWVIATDTNGCISDTAFYMVTFIPSGVDDILNSDINIYPNPTDGLINIMTDLKIEKIELFSVEGKLLKTTMESSMLLNTKGIYFIKVISEKGNIIKRVVVN